MTYPDKALVAGILSQVALRAANESTAAHPEDIAAAMAIAIEHAGIVLDILNKSGNLTDTPPF